MATRASGPRPAHDHPYLALLRPANVATALADVLAGASVAGSSPSVALLWLLASTACLYAGGVVLNDYFDRHLDAAERPERPIPSGRVPAPRAAAMGLGLLAAGVAVAAGAGPTAVGAATAVAAAVLFYDAWAKRHAFLGPLAMGLCRTLNLLLGMAILPGTIGQHWALGWLPLTYITGVTVLSRGEVRGSRRPVARLALGLVGAVTAGAAWLAFRRIGPAGWWGMALAAGLAVRVLPPFWQAARAPVPPAIRHAVRSGVLSLVLLDAVIATSYADIMSSLAVLATAVLAAVLARRFAVT